MTAQPVGPIHQGFDTGTARAPRDIEYAAFSHVTRQLKAAQRGRLPAPAAVYNNTALWTALATDLADTGNSLPDQLKASLLSLSIFSIRHGQAVAAGRATVDALIDVNLAIMKALRGEVRS